MNSMPSFVKSDSDLLRFFKRIQKRSERYPNWRQVYYNCNGMCQYPIKEDGTICGELETLEFHELYYKDGKIYQIVLLCNYHHHSIHNGIVNPRFYKPMVQEDIHIEMLLVGGIDNWKEKYNIKEIDFKYDYSSDIGNNTLDLLFSENS